jgi:hypothetical protein
MTCVGQLSRITVLPIWAGVIERPRALVLHVRFTVSWGDDVFGLFGKKYDYNRIASDFVDEFDSRFQQGYKVDIATIHIALTKFGNFNDDVVETILTKPSIVQNLYVGLLAESCIPWENIISHKTERKFIESVIWEGKRRHRNILDDSVEFYFMLNECRRDPSNTRLRIACFALSKEGPATQPMMTHLASDPMAQLAVQGSLGEDGIIGIIKDLKTAGRI